MKPELKRKNSKQACFHCKVSHRKCDNNRPCSYCSKVGKDCFDVPNKKKRKKMKEMRPLDKKDECKKSPWGEVISFPAHQQDPILEYVGELFLTIF